MGSLSNLQIVGSSEVKKHEKTICDNKESITIVRIGSAAGDTGPWLFLIKKKSELDKNSPLHNLRKNYLQVPLCSKVVPTSNAYMTNEVWCSLAPIIAKGFRGMPVIKDHPDWKVCLTLDGYASHLVPSALKHFID